MRTLDLTRHANQCNEYGYLRFKTYLNLNFT